MVILDSIMPYVALIVVCLLFTIPGIWIIFFTISLTGTTLGVLEEWWLKRKKPAAVSATKTADLAVAAKAPLAAKPAVAPEESLLRPAVLLAAVAVLAPVLVASFISGYAFYEFTPRTVSITVNKPPVVTAAASTTAAADGQAVFETNCALCHQKDGSGVAGTFPPLVSSSWVLGAPDVIVKLVVNGISGPITVNDEIYNNAMPGFADVLNDDELQAVINYIRSSWGNQAELAIDEAFVAEVKKTLGDRTSVFSAAELQ